MSPVLLITSILFGIVLLFFVVYSLFLVYHLFEFSLNKGSALILVVVFVVFSIALTGAILFYLTQINWNASALPFLQQLR